MTLVVQIMVLYWHANEVILEVSSEHMNDEIRNFFIWFDVYKSSSSKCSCKSKTLFLFLYLVIRKCEISFFLIYQSQAVSSAVWHSEWYKCKPDVSKMLLIMMIRAQKPLTLSVGRFYVMSNKTALGVSVYLCTPLRKYILLTFCETLKKDGFHFATIAWIRLIADINKHITFFASKNYYLPK